MDLLQPRHDPPVAAAQPRPVGACSCATCKFIVVDECHYYRGIFGSNVAMVLRRLMRLCARYGGDAPGPTVIFASATTASPAATASELLGHTVAEVTDDGSPQGGRTVALWEPALLRRPHRRERRPGAAVGGSRGGPGDGRPDGRGGADVDVRPLAPRRRTHRARRPGAARGRRTRTRRPRRVLPRRLPGRGPPRPGDAPWPTASCAGWPPPTPSSWASTSRVWTRWCWPASPAPSPRSGSRPGGRADAGQSALIVLIARDDPLDTYLVHHPGALLDKPIERVVIDPVEPVRARSPTALRRNRTPAHRRRGPDVERRGRRRRRSSTTGCCGGGPPGYFPAPGRRSAFGRGHPRLVGRADRDPRDRHRPDARQHRRGPGARRRCTPARSTCTRARATSSTRSTSRTASPSSAPRIPATPRRRGNSPTSSSPGRGERRTHRAGHRSDWCRCRCRHTVIGYLRRRLNGEVIDFVDLDMPTQTLDTMAVMCTIDTGSVAAQRNRRPCAFPVRCMRPSTRRSDCCRWWPAATAATSEACRWRSARRTGLPTIFVYDGYPGGAGFADRGFRQIATWWGATAAAIEACECPRGCPSCVQSPKCGNGNDPLDKAGAVMVLRLVLGELARHGA